MPIVATVRMRRGAFANRRMIVRPRSIAPSATAATSPTSTAGKKLHFGPTMSDAASTARDDRRGRPARSSRCGSRDRSARGPSRRAPDREPRTSPRNRIGMGAGYRIPTKTKNARAPIAIWEPNRESPFDANVAMRSTISSTRRRSAVTVALPRVVHPCQRRWGYSSDGIVRARTGGSRSSLRRGRVPLGRKYST